MKRCFKCGEEKARSEFYAHPMMADGLLSKCKECTKKDVRANRIVKFGQRIAYERMRNKTGKRRKAMAEYHKRTLTANPLRAAAWRAVSRAIRSGRLVPMPCQKCGEPQTEAHHDDYAKPLEVRWLCHLCHREEHGRLCVPKETALVLRTDASPATHCVNGHELSGNNAIRRGRYLACRICRNVGRLRQCQKQE
jgi:hypothetical protein